MVIKVFVSSISGNKEVSQIFETKNKKLADLTFKKL